MTMPKIEFVSTRTGLDDIEELRPRPAKHFMPKWFKDVPATLSPEQKIIPGAISSPGVSTVKICPSFPDYFSLGYIIPMWCDSKLFYNPDNGGWNWQTSDDNVTWDIHANSQFLEWANPYVQGTGTQFVFKAHSPWRIITPKGWSVMQLPLFYHFNQEWSVLPGIIDTDIHNEINQQVLYHGNGREVVINRGDPFALYIPFERSSRLDLEIRSQNEKDIKLFRKKDIDLASKFPPNGLYRRWQRERDKNVR
jgi:hypothetical protein